LGGRLAHGDGVRPGAPYGGSVALGQWVREHWAEFDGWCAARGVDPRGLSAARVLNLAYHVLTRNLDKEARDELDAALTRRPDDVDPETGLAPPSWWRG